MPRWDEQLNERNHKVEGFREDLVTKAWQKFRDELYKSIGSEHTADQEIAVSAATGVALAYMRDQVVAPPWFAPQLRDSRELSRARNRFRASLGKLNVGDVLPMEPIPIGRVMIAQVVGGIVGLSLFGVFFWPAPLSIENRFFLSFVCGSLTTSAALLYVNQNWRLIIHFLKWAGLVTGAAGLTFFVFRYSMLGPQKAIVNSLKTLKTLFLGTETSIDSDIKGTFSRIARRVAGPGKAIASGLLLFLLVLILARPRSKFDGDDGGPAKRQFTEAATRWLDHAVMMAVSLETIEELQKQVETGVDKTLVSETAMKELIASIRRLRDADDVQAFEEAREMVIERLETCGYVVGSRADHYFQRLSMQVVDISSADLSRTVFIWEERLEQFFDKYDLIADGQLAEILSDPTFLTDGTVQKGLVRRS